jgi:hypothetical protein
MATTNDITGDSISSKVNSQAYMDNWENIFGKNKKKEEIIEEKPMQDEKEPVE